MNRKGFTLIELLAVIVIIVIVLLVAIPASIGAYNKSKLRTEDTFVKRLSQMVDSYTTLNIDSINFSSLGETRYKMESEVKQVTVYSGNITVNNLIEEGLIKSSDYINPSNKDANCNKNAVVEIYKDSDFVYCHKIRASSLGCLTDDYIEYINDKLLKDNAGYVSSSNPYVVDTCVWEELDIESGD